MSDETPPPSREATSVPTLHQSRRDRWASSVATFAVVIHSLSALVVFGWYYFGLPRWKHELDSVGIELSGAVILLIGQSDAIVNYWYVGLPLVPIAVICDFLTTRWIARQIGLRWACLGVACITAVLLANVVVGKYIVEQERVQIGKHILSLPDVSTLDVF